MAPTTAPKPIEGALSSSALWLPSFPEGSAPTTDARNGDASVPANLNSLQHPEPGDAGTHGHRRDIRPYTLEETSGERVPWWEVIMMAVWELIPPPSDYALCCCTGERYPTYVNLHVLRTVDFFAGCAMILDAILELVCIFVPGVADVVGIIGNIIIVGAFIGKVKQVLAMPSWETVHRLAFNRFGPAFVPVHSTARRAQQCIFAAETVLVFGPVASAVLHDGAGLDKAVVSWIMFGYRVFLAGFYFSMAIWATCPVWSFTALLVKLSILSRPAPLLTSTQTDTLDSKSKYFYGVREGRGQASAFACTHIRYGRFSPMMATKLADTSSL